MPKFIRLTSPDRLTDAELRKYLYDLLRDLETELVKIPEFPASKNTYTTVNTTENRALDGGTVTLPVLTNIVGTLINDLKQAGVIK